MAWNKRYRVPFQSFTGTQYMVYIYEQTAGELMTLTGSDNPFETQEDQSDDIFTPIRSQTGYLRVIDETGGNLFVLADFQNLRVHLPGLLVVTKAVEEDNQRIGFVIILIIIHVLIF